MLLSVLKNHHYWLSYYFFMFTRSKRFFRQEQKTKRLDGFFCPSKYFRSSLYERGFTKLPCLSFLNRYVIVDRLFDCSVKAKKIIWAPKDAGLFLTLHKYIRKPSKPPFIPSKAELVIKLEIKLNSESDVIFWKQFIKMKTILFFFYLNALSVVFFAPHVFQNWIHGSSIVKFLFKLMRISWWEQKHMQFSSKASLREQKKIGMMLTNNK